MGFLDPARTSGNLLRRLGKNNKFIGYSGNSNVLDSVGEQAFIAGTNFIAVSDNFRATLELPGTSDKFILLHRVIMAHNQSGALPIELIQSPDTNLPTTAHNSINHRMGSTVAAADGVFNADAATGALSGTAGGVFLPVGSEPKDTNLDQPVAIAPGEIFGINADVGGNLTSADVMLAFLWTEKLQSNIQDLDV